MTPDEAATLAGFLKGAYPSLTDEQIDVYQSSLLFEDSALASKAILDGIREWKYPPRYAEIVERIRMLRRVPVASAPAVEEALVDAVVPDWVKRWTFARFVVKPPDLRPFREQHRETEQRGEEPAMGWMPGDAYEVEARALTDEMVRAKVAQVTGAAGLSTPLLDLLGPE